MTQTAVLLHAFVRRHPSRDEKIPGGERHVRKLRKVSKQSNQPSASARRPAGGGAEPSGARRCSVRAVPDLLTGPQPNGSWVVSSGQIITPAGTQVDLGIRVRAKAIALNPNRQESHRRRPHHGRDARRVEVFDTNTGDVLQNYIPFGTDSSGSYSGIAYSADGKYLVFSQDSSNVTIAKVTAEGLLEDDAQVSVPPNNSFITCFPNSPPAAYANPCGTFYTP